MMRKSFSYIIASHSHSTSSRRSFGWNSLLRVPSRHSRSTLGAWHSPFTLTRSWSYQRQTRTMKSYRSTRWLSLFVVAASLGSSRGLKPTRERMASQVPTTAPSRNCQSTFHNANRVVPCPLCDLRGGETSTAAMNPPQGINPLVISAPLVAAAVCRDGIALLALHHISEPLPPRQDEESPFSPLRDLPPDFGGPFRIQSLDLQGSALLTAGWRPDAQFLATQMQAVGKEERSTVGCTSADVLATQGSLLLATAALVGGDTRELQCVALLASPDSSRRPLWLMDSTGAYTIRAVALGGGSLPINAALNDQLRHIDWQDMSAQDGLDKLLALAAEQVKKDDSGGATPPHVCIEAAVVDFDSRRLARKFLANH